MIKDQSIFPSVIILLILTTFSLDYLWILLGENWRCSLSRLKVACEQALLFRRARRVSRERASERRTREGQRKGELATISHKISFVLRPDEGKYNWLKNDVPKNKFDWKQAKLAPPSIRQRVKFGSQGDQIGTDNLFQPSKQTRGLVWFSSRKENIASRG